MPDYSLELKGHSNTSHPYYQIQFNAMASLCEILIKSKDQSFCHLLAKQCINEVQRIENKYSRYQSSSLLTQVNQSNGKTIKIDQETFQLLNYAKELYELSDGLFDISSGVLGKLWNFKNQTSIPHDLDIQQALSLIGFNKIQYTKTSVTLPKAMQIDFGGIGKEYAVDRVADILHASCKKNSNNYLVNLGGDLFAKNYTINNDNEIPWKIGLENSSSGFLELKNGAVATSGTSQRSFIQNGKTYSHLLNPKTGWPIENPPKSITCFADRCVLAGTFSSLAMLQGTNAESFLKAEAIEHIIVR